VTHKRIKDVIVEQRKKEERKIEREKKMHEQNGNMNYNQMIL
jgi:hypothetical protein